MEIIAGIITTFFLLAIGLLVFGLVLRVVLQIMPEKWLDRIYFRTVIKKSSEYRKHEKAVDELIK